MPESKPSTQSHVNPSTKHSPKHLKVAFYVLLSLILLAIGALFLIILTKLPGSF